MECALQMRSGRTIQLRIHIPVFYPNEPPQFTLNPSINHPWVDANGKVNLPMLQDWKVNYTLVEAMSNAQTGILGGGAPAPVTSSHSQQDLRQSRTGLHGVNIAQYLEQYSTDELHGFLTHPQKFETLIRTLMAESPVIKSIKELQQEIVQLSELNLSREDEITELQNQIAIIKSTEYTNTRQVYEEKITEHQEIQNRVNIPKLVNDLELEAMELNKRAEELHQSAANGQEENPETALEEYCSLRQEFHKTDALAKASIKLC
eukprot:g1640.t2